MESASRHAKSLQGGPTSPTHSDATNRLEQDFSKECYWCGQSSHRPTQCPYRSAKLHNCGKQGHLKTEANRPTNQSLKRSEEKPNPRTVLEITRY